MVRAVGTPRPCTPPHRSELPSALSAALVEQDQADRKRSRGMTSLALLKMP